MRTEHGRPVVDAPTQSETVDLKATAICQNRSVPAHEAMQAAQFRDRLISRAQRQVISVSEDDLCAGLPQLCRGKALHCGLGSDRHEYRSFDGPMSRLQPAQTGSAIGL